MKLIVLLLLLISVYDSTINVGVINAFASAAFRFGHTEIPEHLPFRNYGQDSTVTLGVETVREYSA